jgi:peptide/nickel transport system permease protein
MLKILRDLIRYSSSFRFGFIVIIFILVMVVLSFISPYPPDRMRVVPTNKPPSTQHILGTTSTGQDVFWMMTFAVRNSLIIAGLAVLIGRSIGVPLGMISGYLGGRVDRVLSSIVDSVIVIPRLPLLILIASLMRGQLSLTSLGILIGLLDWAFPSKRYRAQILSLRERDFTNTAVFSGMNSWKIVLREHLPFVIPYLLADAVSGFLFAIGFEVTLATLGLSAMSMQSIGTMIYWGNYYGALLAHREWILAAPVVVSIIMVIGFYTMSTGISAYLDPRSRLARLHVKG